MTLFAQATVGHHATLQHHESVRCPTIQMTTIGVS
jgi:hypothetical protein